MLIRLKSKTNDIIVDTNCISYIGNIYYSGNERLISGQGIRYVSFDISIDSKSFNVSIPDEDGCWELETNKSKLKLEKTRNNLIFILEKERKKMKVINLDI